MTEFTDFTEIDEPSNTSPKCLVTLCLDVSSSMGGEKIKSLNLGVEGMIAYLKKDKTARQVVDLAIVTFASEAQIHSQPTTIEQFQFSRLVAAGATALSAGLRTSLDLIEKRKKYYKNIRQNYYRPFLIIITDGDPTDGELYLKYADQIEKLENEKGLILFALATEGANQKVMNNISRTREPLPVSYKNFSEFFAWLSASIQIKSASIDDTKPLQLPSTNKWKGDWGTI